MWPERLSYNGLATFEGNNMNVIDYDLIEDVSILYNSRIILYGTGVWGEKTFLCLKEAGLCPNVVCQTEITMERFHNLKVYTFLDVLNRYDDSGYLLIIASIDYYKEMLDMCASFINTKICTLYGFYTSLKLHVNEDVFPKGFTERIKAGLGISQVLNFSKLKMSAINRFVQASSIPEDYIWIFQPGKVGSQSIWNSVQDRSMQFHTLTGAYRFKDIEKEYLDFYLGLIQKKKFKIISCVREPISRDIAAFFQNSDLELWPYHEFNCNIFALCGRNDFQEVYMDMEGMKKRCPLWEGSLNNSFRKYTQAIMHYRQDVFSWFDYEIKNNLGIDIYDYPFDREKSYVIVEKNNVQILLIKMEYLSELEKVIGDFIGDKEYRLINRNRASEKIYRYAYADFKKNIRIPSDYFDFYYDRNVKYEHFYSDKEIKVFYERWKNYVFRK